MKLKKTVTFVTVILLSFVLGLTDINASTIEDSEVKKFVRNISDVQTQWKSGIVEKGNEIYSLDENHIGYIYRVFINELQEGYIVYSLDDGIVKANFEGQDTAINYTGKVYYLPPDTFTNDIEEAIRVTESTNSDKSDNSVYGSAIAYYHPQMTWSSSDGVSYYHPMSSVSLSISNGTPNLSSNVTHSSGSYQAVYKIQNVPSYLNELVSNGCTPTATASLIAYYDNEWYNGISNYDGFNDYAMTAEKSWFTYKPTEVKNLINNLATRMHTDKPGITNDGTTMGEWQYGLTDFLNNSAVSNYQAYYSVINFVDDQNPSIIYPNEWYDFTQLIERGNPVILSIKHIDGDPLNPFGEPHTVVGIGYYTNYYTNNGVIVYDNHAHGEVYISDKYITFFGYIFEKSEVL